MPAVLTFPTTPESVERAWDRYCDLVNEQRDDDALRTDVQYQQRIAQAWEEWRDLYLAARRTGQ